MESELIHSHCSCEQWRPTNSSVEERRKRREEEATLGGSEV